MIATPALLSTRQSNWILTYCPEWTNHNVSDPGVALIELFAWMSEYMLYRLNQVPDAFYTRMLNLLGEDVLPASAAQTDITFWLLDDAMVSIPPEQKSQRSAKPTIQSFSRRPSHSMRLRHNSLPCRQQALVVNSCHLMRISGETHTGLPVVDPGAALYLGFDRSLTGTVLDLRFGVANQGIGVDPTRPPVRWQIYTAESWVDTDGLLTRLVASTGMASFAPLCRWWSSQRRSVPNRDFGCERCSLNLKEISRPIGRYRRSTQSPPRESP